MIWVKVLPQNYFATQGLYKGVNVDRILLGLGFVSLLILPKTMCKKYPFRVRHVNFNKCMESL